MCLIHIKVRLIIHITVELYGVDHNALIKHEEINGLKLYFVNYVRARAKSSLQYFIRLKLKTVKAYSVVKSVNFTHGYEYINRARKC